MMVTIRAFFLTCLLSEGLAKEFKVIYFGGQESKEEARLYNLLSPNAISVLPDLSDWTHVGPFGSVIEGKMTICGGSFSDYCHSFHDGQWQRSMQMVERTFSSAVTTFDGASWTFFGGFSVQQESIATWKIGEDSFLKLDSPFELREGLCSIQYNQTHTIVSRGGKTNFWYSQSDHSFDKWSQSEETETSFSACGLVLNRESGQYHFVSAGGLVEGSTTPHTNEVLMYNFEDGSWNVGQTLSQEREKACYVQFQNSFVVIGGFNGPSDFAFTDVLRFDLQEGWVEMPMKLFRPNFFAGALHVPQWTDN